MKKIILLALLFLNFAAKAQLNLVTQNGKLVDTSVVLAPVEAAIQTNTTNIATNTSAIAGKQATLVSATNVKSVNGNTILGSGNQRIIINNPSGMYFYGDSYTAGYGLSTPLTDGYPALLSTFLNKTYTNRAISSTGTFRAVNLSNVDINAGTFTSSYNQSMPVYMVGLNDVRVSTDYRGARKTINAFKSLITNQFIQSSIYAGNGVGVTRTGTWNTAYNNTAFGGKAATAAATAASGSYIEYTFLGDNVAVGLQARDGVNTLGANFDVTIDGSAMGSFTTNNQTNGVTDNFDLNRRTPMALNFLNLADSNHIIRLTTTTSDSLIVDYFGIMKRPETCYPMVLFHIPYLNNYEVGLGENIRALAMNNSIDSLVALYPDYPISVPKTENYFTDYQTDTIHPSVKGHRQIYKSAIDILSKYININLGSHINLLGTGNNVVSGGLQIKGTTNSTTPMPLFGYGVEIKTPSIASGTTFATYDYGTASSLPIAFVGSSISFTAFPNAITFSAPYIKSTQYRLSALNTAPVSSTDTGTLGEIRVTAGFIYICTATNTWVRTALTTF